jgi:hypothetical protein
MSQKSWVPLISAVAGSGARVVGALTVSSISLDVRLTRKNPRQLVSCTRVARWCDWLDPDWDQRGTNALTYYYEHSTGPHGTGE